ncbi:MAG TPA: hypothetical protein VMR17_01285 [Xanthobacteraceae bacterium]|jgi:hypothetical protein|nr:hypothetical protein [Xanthobacteraceae bacterium]
MGPASFAIFSFLNRIASRAPDFFKIPKTPSSKSDFAWKSDANRVDPQPTPSSWPGWSRLRA